MPTRQASQDANLLTDLRLGLPEAVEAWYRQFSPQLTRYVSGKISNKNDVEEIVRDTFLGCLRHLPLFQGRSSLKTWMIRIASHEIADYYRRRYAKKIIHSLPLSNLLFVESPKDMHETSRLVVQTLNSIRADYKQLLLLKYVDQQSVKDIADELHRSIKSIESDLFRARQEFKNIYNLLLIENL